MVREGKRRRPLLTPKPIGSYYLGAGIRLMHCIVAVLVSLVGQNPEECDEMISASAETSNPHADPDWHCLE